MAIFSSAYKNLYVACPCFYCGLLEGGGGVIGCPAPVPEVLTVPLLNGHHKKGFRVKIIT